MMQNNSICQCYSVFTANSGFQLLFKHSTILRTTDYLPAILVVLEDGPIKSQNRVSITFEFLGPGR